ncbi:MAG: ATP-binding protein [Methylacidiphilales bacterium]|nr:ATP-binding protein [Candidatus Methylacidiphilales bacterium]
MRFSRSIRFKLISLYVGLLTVIFICFGAYTYYGFHHFLIHSLDQALNRRALQIASTIVEELPNRGPAYVAGEIQARYAPELNERVIRITDSNGEIIYASRNTDLLSPYVPRGNQTRGVEEQPFYREEIQDRKQPIRVVSLDHRLANGLVCTVEVGAPENDIAKALDHLLVTLGIGFSILILLSILGGYSLLGRALSPVDEIVSAAEQITFKNLSQRLPVPQTGDEFERISLALNRMIQRLEEAFQIANRFSADASHELRTPLTIIRGELEAMVKSPTLTSDALQRVADMLEEVERLTRIVEGLLLVSRLESGEAQMQITTLDLGELVNSVADQMELLSQDKLLTMKREINLNVFVEGDAMRLKQVVVNLLDNAIKYTPEGGTIILGVRTNKTHAILEAADTGIGIQPDALPHVFKRFFRSGEARAGRIAGTGLGLAIVQSITEAHGGMVFAESNANAGSQFRVELPLVHKEKQNNDIQLAT